MNNRSNFIKATVSDVLKLRILARDSEAHWGYNEEFMRIFDETYNITEDFIRNSPVYLLREDDSIVAFWGMVYEDYGWKLEYFYVSETSLMKGYGKIMWNHLVSWSREQNITEFEFVTSPQAIGFYEKMGAIHDCNVKSTIDGREIPHLRFYIKEE